MHRATLAHVKSLLPTDAGDQFYLALFVLHGLAAVASGIMSMYCEVSFASQQAMRTVPVQNFSRMQNTDIQMFIGATPWSEDGQFDSHRWNPYILVLAFQWLTAWFAFCNIRGWYDLKDIKGWAIAGVFLGLVVIGVWACLPNPRSQEPCWAMYILLTLSFIAAPLIFSRYFVVLEHNRANEKAIEQEEESKSDDFQRSFQIPEETPPGDTGAPRRVWNIPKRIAGLKKGAADERQGLLQPPSSTLSFNVNQAQVAALRRIQFQRAVDAVGFRYAEYCITAPLLFLAVMCLLVTDAPAWLFLAGYWFVQACNAIGISLHYNIAEDVSERTASKGAVDKWFEDIMSEGIWCVVFYSLFFGFGSFCVCVCVCVRM
jgi:hypothetical protein